MVTVMNNKIRLTNTDTLPRAQESIDTTKAQAIDRIAIYFAILSLLAYPATINRALAVGSQLSITAHTITLPIILGLFFYRHELTYQFKASLFVALGLIISGVGMYEFGPNGSSVMIGLISTLIALFYLDKKSTIISIIVSLVLFSFSAYAYIWGGRALQVDSLPSADSFPIWSLTLMTSVMCFVMFGITTIRMQKQLTESLFALEQKNLVISQQKNEIEHLVNHDSLTGLLSSRAADSQLKQILKTAQEENHRLALLFIDLDGFKTINDGHGHAAGDRILKTVAARITSTIRSTDVACRVGGDEFMIIVNELDRIQDLSSLCARLVQSINKPVRYSDDSLSVGSCIGAAIYPYCASDALGLREKADGLMYQVKRTGKNNYLLPKI